MYQIDKANHQPLKMPSVWKFPLIFMVYCFNVIFLLLICDPFWCKFYLWSNGILLNINIKYYSRVGWLNNSYILAYLTSLRIHLQSMFTLISELIFFVSLVFYTRYPTKDLVYAMKTLYWVKSLEND